MYDIPGVHLLLCQLECDQLQDASAYIFMYPHLQIRLALTSKDAGSFTCSDRHWLLHLDPFFPPLQSTYSQDLVVSIDARCMHTPRKLL